VKRVGVKIVFAILALGLVMAPLAIAQQIGSVWDGVFTEAQALRGQDAYEGACSSCHGSRLNGAADDPDMRSAPPLARVKFLRNWEGRSLATLFEYTRTTMPEDNPGSLSAEEFVDVIAYMLSVSKIPTGEDELRPDLQSLASSVIQQQQ
jgi:mono/diheme cytochrome c family protein